MNKMNEKFIEAQAQEVSKPKETSRAISAASEGAQGEQQQVATVPPTPSNEERSVALLSQQQQYLEKVGSAFMTAKDDQLLRYLKSGTYKKLFPMTDLVSFRQRKNQIIMDAKRLGISELEYMDNAYDINGKLGVQAKVIIKYFNDKGIFHPIRTKYVYDEDKKSVDAQYPCYVVAYTMEKNIDITKMENFTEENPLFISSGRLYYEQVRKKGNPIWETHPTPMLNYRARITLIRMVDGDCCPYSIEELKDINS